MAIEQVASTDADTTVAALNRDFTVTIPSGTGRVILDFIGYQQNGSALTKSSTIDPGGGEEAQLTLEEQDGDPGGDDFWLELHSLLEANMPTGPTETLRFAQDATSVNAGRRGPRQVVTVQGAAQVVHTAVAKHDLNAALTVTATRSGGGNFVAGSMVWAAMLAQGENVTYTVSGDVTEVRDENVGVDINSFVFAHGTLAGSQASASATFTRDTGAIISKVAIIAVLEPRKFILTRPA